MSEESALLKSVTSAPKDHLPRLVYADWLDEHGRADEAEFLRLLCAATKRSKRSVATRKQLKKLQGDLEEKWCGRVKRGLHELASEGELLDASWGVFSRHDLWFYISAEERHVRNLRTLAEVKAAALVALRRKCPGLTRDKYESAFSKCLKLCSLADSLVHKLGDTWLANRGSIDVYYGLKAEEFDGLFRRECPDFKLSTCRHALRERYVGWKIR